MAARNDRDGAGRAQDRGRIREQRRYLREQNALYGPRMQELPAALVAQIGAGCRRQQPLRAWRSRAHLAVLWQESGERPLRLSICRTSMGPDGRFLDGITWEELQRIKAECGYGDVEAVEVYPRDSDVVNVANQRHLWILPGGSGCSWTREDPRG